MNKQKGEAQMADDIRHEHHNSEGHQETTIMEHHHRAIIGFDKTESRKY